MRQACSHVGISRCGACRKPKGAAILPVRMLEEVRQTPTLCAALIASRYYGPFRETSDYGPVFCDVRDPQFREQHKAVSCPDKILTAFCQLGALRVKARRCLIFMFDVNHAYIMAEATQTLSLENDNTHEPGDQLWSKYFPCSPVSACLHRCVTDTAAECCSQRQRALLANQSCNRANFQCSGTQCHSSRYRLLRDHRKSAFLRRHRRPKWRLARQRLRCQRFDSAS